MTMPPEPLQRALGDRYRIEQFAANLRHQTDRTR